MNKIKDNTIHHIKTSDFNGIFYNIEITNIYRVINFVFKDNKQRISGNIIDRYFKTSSKLTLYHNYIIHNIIYNIQSRTALKW